MLCLGMSISEVLRVQLFGGTRHFNENATLFWQELSFTNKYSPTCNSVAVANKASPSARLLPRCAPYRLTSPFRLYPVHHPHTHCPLWHPQRCSPHVLPLI